MDPVVEVITSSVITTIVLPFNLVATPDPDGFFVYDTLEMTSGMEIYA
ncbi:hypothetical protein VPHD239_0107 [Vibrio phage D239]